MSRNRCGVENALMHVFQRCTRIEKFSDVNIFCWNRELDICRQGGRSFSSSSPPHPMSATADARLPTQMIGTVAAVLPWRQCRELHVVCQSDNADRKREACCSSRYKGVQVPVPEHEQRPWRGINGWFAVVGVGRSRHLKCNWHASPASSHRWWGLPDLGHSQRVEGRPTSNALSAAVIQTTARAQPYQLRLWKVETKSVGNRSRLDDLDACGHLRS